MAFFEIKDRSYNSDQIETEILKSLRVREIPFDYEKKFVEKYNLENVRKDYLAHPLTRLKILLDHLPRWFIRVAKLFPFYGSVRKFLKIDY